MGYGITGYTPHSKEMITIKILVSIASYAERFLTLPLCLKNVFHQTHPPDYVFLFIKQSDISRLPQEVLDYTKNGLKIQLAYPDLKPHNKYFHIMQQYPDDIVITLDDDVLYPLDLIEKLILSYHAYPDARSAGRAHKIRLDSNGNILPYEAWERECKIYNAPSLSLFACGVGGVLYPPHCMPDETFNSDAIKKLCLYADDVWLKAMQLLQYTPVVLIKQQKQHPECIPDVAEHGLYQTNKLMGRNNLYIKNVFDTYHITSERINII